MNIKDMSWYKRFTDEGESVSDEQEHDEAEDVWPDRIEIGEEHRNTLKDIEDPDATYVVEVRNDAVKSADAVVAPVYTKEQRNALCSCGSGKKFKRCCMKKEK